MVCGHSGPEGPEVMEEVMNLVSGAECEGYDCVTFEMDNVKLRTIMTTSDQKDQGG